MKNLPVIVLALATVIAATPATAALEEEILSFPIPGTVERYVANEAAIVSLRSALTDVTQPAETRLAALRALNLDFPLAAQITVRGLTTDPDTAVALAAIDVLLGSVVMMNHEHSGEMPPGMAYMMEQYQANIEALRKAELDERKEISLRAAELLVSLDDVPTYTSIAIGAETGRYSGGEATNLFMLGSTRLASPFLASYLGSGKLDAETNAIAYLGAQPEYQPRIREAYFLNAAAEPSLRADAAEALGAFDATFATYALEQLPSLQSTPELYSTTLDSYLNNQQVFGTAVDPDLARQLSESIDTVLRDTTDVPTVQNLNRLQQDLRGIYLNAPTQ